MTSTRAGEQAGGGGREPALVPMHQRTASRAAKLTAGADRRAFGATLVAVFAVGAWAVAWATLARHASIGAMGGMSMPGGWLRPCGSSAGRAFAAFAGMWGAMTVAMMLPVLAPMLWQYGRRAGPPGAMGNAARVAIVGGAYLSVWMALGAMAFPLGDALTVVATRAPAFARALPFVAGAVVVAAGALQFSAWKARRLACCRHVLRDARASQAGAAAAWLYGMRAAAHCSACCGNLMAVALAAGAMDLRVMVAVTIAIAAERVAPAGARVARAVGWVAVAGGVAMIVRAAGVG
nr:DUF2182 domain-containing protein [Burkholderia dolosa]